ncbi:MAG: AAA family ATPase [Gammaproteobacteria bacterium]|nr:AAA family ATPase [Gammaproteobacteria bacterium]
MAAVDADATRLIVSIVGPESSGKTTLAERLAMTFGAPGLAEYAREYLTGRPNYTENDLDTIARGQQAQEHALLEAGHPLVVLDTDLIVIRVWWQEKYGYVPDWVDQHLREQRERVYLLTCPDLPWEPDPLRESPADRDRLFEIYRVTLDQYGFSYSEIRGTGEPRYELGLAAVRRASS